MPVSPFPPVLPADLPQWLADNNALIVDIRPPAAFSSARIPHAVSLSVPSTLLKRPLFSLDRLAAMLSSPSARNRFSAWPAASRILVYDADSQSIGDSSNINGLLRKFSADGFKGELVWLKGGFHAVWRDCRGIVDALPPTPEPEGEEEEEVSDKNAHPVLRPRHLPMAAFTLSSTTAHNSSHFNPSSGTILAGFEPPGKRLQTVITQSSPAAVSHPAFNPFFDTVRQNTELSHGITERIPLHLPRRVRRRISELPFRWLQDIARRAANAPHTTRSISDTSSSESENDSDGANHAAIEEGKEALAMQFFKIELSEQRRLMGIMEHHSKESGQSTNGVACSSIPFPYSITAGVEKGTKNRYRHIWPFEHARVRLHQKSEADDDYINASYIQPLGTSHHYIATQGPLPATFTDFWTLCWEQNVHVIVMLTREVEGALVKCGSYWTDTVFGPLRLRIVSTEGSVIPDERPVSAGFFGQHASLPAYASRPTVKKFPKSAGAQRRYRHRHHNNKRSETIKRVFELTHTGYPNAKPRRIVHFQYLEWPDMNVPDDPRGILGLIKQVEGALKESGANVNPSQRKQGKANEPTSISDVDEETGIAKHALGNSPVLLHCSAGVGRTGGFIVVDAVLDAIRREIRKERDASRDNNIQQMDVDQPPITVSLPMTSGAGHSSNDGMNPASALTVHVPVVSTPMADDPPASSNSDLEVTSAFPSETSQWARNVSNETGISGNALPQTQTPTVGFNFSTAPSSMGASSQPHHSQGSYYSSSTSLGTSVSGASSSSKANFPSTTCEPSTSTTSKTLFSELSTNHSTVDQRLRTMSAPSGTNRQASQPPPNNPSRHATFPLRLDFSQIAKDNFDLVKPPPFNFGAVPLAPTLSRDIISSDGEIPSRSQSPSVDERASGPCVPPQLNLRSLPPPVPQPIVLTASETSPFEPQTKTFDYKEPRPLHEDFTPPSLSTFEDPIWEVVQDMREQRMSLCQSLRQYVFVHAAIIEGSLMVLDEENEIADGLRPRQQPSEVEVQTESLPAKSLRTRTSASYFHSADSAASSSSSYSIGKRPSTPTELRKENKQGELMLSSKRPSIKRKQKSNDGLDHSAEDIRYHPVPLRAPSSVVHAGGMSAPSARAMPP